MILSEQRGGRNGRCKGRRGTWTGDYSAAAAARGLAGCDGKTRIDEIDRWDGDHLAPVWNTII